jgi:hypothetical protein
MYFLKKNFVFYQAGLGDFIEPEKQEGKPYMLSFMIDDDKTV